MLDNFRASTVLAQLKDFQRASVEHAFEQLYGPNDASRFLVADEVGLGKTMVARGLIARTIEHLAKDPDRRIDIIYICSNQAIAQQNIRRLNVIPDQGFSFSSRMTMIARDVGDLERNRVNFVSFTPGTSFDLKSSAGMSSERVLLYWLLRRAWGASAMKTSGAKRLLKCGVAETNWPTYLRHGKISGNKVDEQLLAEFTSDLEEIDARARFDELAPHFTYKGTRAWNIRAQRNELIGELRARLATRCVSRLEPDLVILDEFQRFRSLMREDNPAGKLAQELFDFKGNKTLLLSATPYKMYTSSADQEDDHHRDFVDTVHFLLGDNHASFDTAIGEFRRTLLDVHNSSPETLRRARKAVEVQLKKAMVRTERLGAGDDRNGMLVEVSTETDLETADVRSYVALEQAAMLAEAAGTLEYWKSVPLFANFMDGYKIDEQIAGALLDPETRVATREHLKAAGGVDWHAWRKFGKVETHNPRFRALAEQTVAQESWRMLWLAPSLPYYELGGPWSGTNNTFTKRLIFSSWSGVPKAVSSLLSYEVERQMFSLRSEPINNRSKDRIAIKGLLQFRHATGSDEAASMTSFAMVYPSPTLAELGDPLLLARERGRQLTLDETKSAIGQKIRHALDRLPPPADNDSAGTDPRWYWAAALLLDKAAKKAGWMGHQALYAGKWLGDSERDDDDSNFQDHIALASSMYRYEIPLGQQPDDLVDVLTDLALGAPGVVALRSLNHQFGSESTDAARIPAAARISWGFRSLFNLPDVNSLVRSANWEQEYWRSVAQYCANGCLTSVLDEYLHVLRESLGFYQLSDEESGGRDLMALANKVVDAIHVRTTSLVARDHLGESDTPSPRFRTRYAMRFGAERAETEKTVVSAEHLRASFNSPFWPFVLTSTSVGQEGLDFHLYCHAVMHWNLPHNPVDLEQREGRVHRYKGHAIRRNLAAKHASDAWSSDGDPWKAMFAAAADQRDDGENELMPYWIFPGEAKIERHVPMLPLSREVAKLAQLKRDVARYRLVFGQARQDDLLEYLGDVPEDKRRELRVDLSPAPVGPLEDDEVGTAIAAILPSHVLKTPDHVRRLPQRDEWQQAGVYNQADADVSGASQDRKQFWSELLPHLRQDDPATWANVTPRVSSDLSTPAIRGVNVQWCLVVHIGRAFPRLWIDVGDAEMNAKILDDLRNRVDPLVAGIDFSWETKESARSCTVSTTPIENCGWTTPAVVRAKNFPAVVQRFRAFKAALSRHLPSSVDEF